jgi:hypothetical protein
MIFQWKIDKFPFLFGDRRRKLIKLSSIKIIGRKFGFKSTAKLCCSVDFLGRKNDEFSRREVGGKIEWGKTCGKCV